MSISIAEGLDFALDTLPQGVAMRVKAALTDRLRSIGPSDPSFKMLDLNIDGSGGAAFLWEDVLALSDIVKVTDFVLSGFPPNKAAELIVNLFVLWRKLRSTRVNLSKEEFLALRAIKNGANSMSSLAVALGKTEKEITSLVGILNERRYQETVPLVEVSGGEVRTRF